MTLQADLNDFATRVGAEVRLRAFRSWFVRALVPTFTINSPTVLTTPTGLSWAVGAGQTWVFEACLIGDVNSVPDIRVQVNAPATIGRFSSSSIETALVRHAPINTLALPLAVTTGADEIRITGGFSTNAAGTASIQLRNDIGTTVQTFFAGSWLKADRVS